MNARTAMLTIMKTRLVPAALALLVLTGCTPAEPHATTAPSATWTAPAYVAAADIVTVDDGIAWARGLDGTVSDEELVAGIVTIGELVPQLDLQAIDNNDIGRKLIKLTSDIHSGEGGSQVSRINAIIDELEASIAKG